MKPNFKIKRNVIRAEGEHGEKKTVVELIDDPTWQPRATLPTPTPEAKQAFERTVKTLERAMPELVGLLLNATLNELDRLPPLDLRHKTHTDVEQLAKSREDLKRDVDAMVTAATEFKTAVETEDYRRAVSALFVFNNMKTAVDARWNEPELSSGRRNIGGASIGGKKKAEKYAAKIEPLKEEVILYLLPRMLTATNKQTEFRAAAKRFKLHANTIRRWWNSRPA